MNPFANRFQGESWVWPVTGMCCVLGFMITMAWVTTVNRSSRIGLAMSDQRARFDESIVDPDRYVQIQKEITKLREENTKLQNAISSQGGQSKAINDSLQELKIFAGLTEVEGEGVVVKLKDLIENGAAGASPNLPVMDIIIHDTDVLKVVNELISAGADAISVNDIRVAGTTSFRCAGPIVYMNGERISSPFEIRAIGTTKRLMGAMSMPGGVLSDIKQTDPRMVQLEPSKLLKLPAYNGPTTRKIAKPSKTKESK